MFKLSNPRMKESPKVGGQHRRPQTGTPFVATTLFVLTTLNGAGQLAPIDRSEWPAGGGPVFIASEAGCLIQRGRMANPQKYVCQGFRSAPTAQWMPNNDGAVEPPPPEVDHIESKNNVQVGKLEKAEQAPKPKQVAKRTADRWVEDNGR
jgi:hypothetical protein